MRSIFDVLEAIEKRPEMYVGYSDRERGQQLRNLELFLVGYSVACELHGVDQPEFVRHLSAASKAALHAAINRQRIDRQRGGTQSRRSSPRTRF